MISSEWQSVGFVIVLSRLFEDADISSRELSTLNKFKILDAQNVIALSPKGQAVDNPSSALLKVKNEIV